MELTQQNRAMPGKTSPEAIEFITKYGALGTWILIGLLGKFGLDMVTGRKFTYRYIFGSGFLAVCAGWLSYQWCMSHPTINPGVVVSVSALASRDIILFISMVDWPGLLRIITTKKVDKK